MSEKQERIYMNPKAEAPSEDNKEVQHARDDVEKDEQDDRMNSLRRCLLRILAGDLLAKNAIKRQAGVIVIIGVFIVLGTGNRYSCQQAHIREAELKKELSDAKNKAFSSFSLLTEKSRRSKLLEGLKAMNDSSLHVAEQPPYIVEIPQKVTNEQ